MAPPYVLHDRPELDRPVLVAALLGWIDAGASAAAAMGVLESEVAARPLATFDGDTFLDYRARRPLVQIRDGVNTGLVWPEIRLLHGIDKAGNSVVLLTGHEPDSNWRLFLDCATGLVRELGVRMMVGLGAYPYAVPHTRPPRISVTAGSADVVGNLPYQRSSVDVPGGMQAALEAALAAHIPTTTLWAQVPHYVASFPYPEATVTLLDALHDVAGIVVDASIVRQDARAHRRRLDELVANSEEHIAMLRALEEAYDAETEGPPPLRASDLPSGEELVAELERFLREQGP